MQECKKCGKKLGFLNNGNFNLICRNQKCVHRHVPVCDDRLKDPSKYSQPFSHEKTTH